MRRLLFLLSFIPTLLFGQKDTTRTLVGKDTVLTIGTTTIKSVNIPYSYPERTVVTVVKPFVPKDSTIIIVPSAIEGFGSQVTGGTGYPVKMVNSLTVSAVREAIGTGNCIVKFAVSGNIPAFALTLSNVKNLTIDGEGKIKFTGTTNSGSDLIRLNSSCSNIILKGIKFRNGGNDILGIQCPNVVITNCSFKDAYDGLIDITGSSARNITIQYNIIGGSRSGAMLYAYGAQSISLINNVCAGRDRLPNAHNAQGSWPDVRPLTVSYLMAEVANNIMVNYGDRASIASYGGSLQLKNNYYENSNGIKLNPDVSYNDGGSSMFCSGNITMSGQSIGITNHAEWVIPVQYRVTLKPANQLPALLKGVVGTGANDTDDNTILSYVR